MGWRMISPVMRHVKVEGYTDQQVDRRSVSGRTHAEVQVGRSPLDAHLPLGSGKQPAQRFRTGYDRGDS